MIETTQESTVIKTLCLPGWPRKGFPPPPPSATWPISVLTPEPLHHLAGNAGHLNTKSENKEESI